MDWSHLSNKFKNISFKHNIDYEQTHNLLEVVKNFIAKKELIIYGGIAIDYALRLKGSQLYDNLIHPDIDVYSPNYLKDAKELVDELSDMGFKNVNAIKGIHTLTMKIRCDFIYVLDISYVPPSVFAKIPILKYNGFTIVDPIFQMMDIHSSLCFPYSGAPLENVINRHKKDIERYNILTKFYHPRIYINKKIKLVNNKTTEPKLCNSSTGKIIVKKFIKLNVDLSVLPKFIVKDKSMCSVAITGFAAYAIIRKTLDEMAELFNIKIKITSPKLEIQISKDNIYLDMPDTGGNNNICFLTYEYIDTITTLSKNHPNIHFERYNSYLDIDYEHIKFNNVIIYSTELKIIAGSYVNIGDNIYCIATIQHVLLYFLFQFHLTNYIIYLEYYIHLLNIIKAAENIFKSLMDKLDNEAKGELINIFNNSLFAPIISPFGTKNISVTNIIQEAKKIISLNDTDNIPPIIGIKDIDFEHIIKDLPNNIYPYKPLQFINAKNILYSKNGKKIKPSIKEKFFE